MSILKSDVQERMLDSSHSLFFIVYLRIKEKDSFFLSSTNHNLLETLLLLLLLYFGN